MSARKAILLKSDKKLNLSAKKGNLNSTVLSSNGNSNGRVRINNPNLTSLVLAPKEDYDTLFDTAYNEYLQACMKKEILLRTIQQQNSICNNQLEKQTEKLSDLEEQTLELDIEIESKTTQVTLVNTLKEISQSVEGSSFILKEDIEKCMQKLIIILEKATRKLFLNNIEHLETEEDYTKLQELLQKCVDVVKKFNSFTEDIDGTNKLSDCLEKNLKLQDELIKKNLAISDLQTEIIKQTLEKSSELLDT